MYEVKQLSSEEMEALRAERPHANIQEYQLLEDGDILGYFSTADEAATEVRRWEGRDVVQDAINNKLSYLIDGLEQLGSWYGLDSAEVRHMLKDSV